MSTNSADSGILGQILVERYGLDGRPPRSVAEVAERHGITRAEVRGIEGPLVKKLKTLLPRNGP
jgi:DNA-directed RNA polymerase sigma subunit (sigma70/sigma32)